MKLDASFGLETAFWPAFLVEDTGTIKHANLAARQTFGSAVERDSCHLSTIWDPANETKADLFLGRPERAVSSLQELKFRLKNGLSCSYSTYICPVVHQGQKGYYFQLFPRNDGPGTARELAPRSSSENLARPPAAPAPVAPSAALDSNSAQKQKLDCALQLARSVSLDFNNALTSILGHTSLILAKAAPDHPWRNSLVEIEKSAARAAEIANDLAAFSRHEKDAKVQRSGNLNLLLQRTVDFFRTREVNEIKWSLLLEKRLLAVKFDEAKMQQALLKILENSVQALGSDRRVTVSSRNLDVAEPSLDREIKLAPGNYVLIEVTDQGCGIPSEIMPRIFEPFFTTKDPARHRGLGLAWVYGVVTNHGGAVAVSSQPGAGASVRIYLPASEKFVKEDPLPDSALHGKETILMVDDEDLLLTMGQMVLSSYGYDVLTAASGQKALEIFKRDKRHIDLLVTDLVMPNMSGRELVEKTRMLSPTTRILCTSGYVRSKTEEESESYLRKPFTSQELLQKVRQILQQ